MSNQKYIRAKALVVGIDQYEQANQLDNAVNDAKAIADILRQLKFYVRDSYNEGQIQCKEWGLNKLLDKMCHYIGHNAATKQKIQDCLYDMGGNQLTKVSHPPFFFGGGGGEKKLINNKCHIN